MNAYTYPSLVSACAFMLIGLFTFWKSESPARIPFSTLCLLTVVWQLAWSILFNVTDQRLALMIVKFGYGGIIFIPITYYHVIARVCQVRTPNLALFYGIAVLFLILHLFSELFIAGVYSYYWGFYPRAGSWHPAYLAFIGWVLGLGLIHIVRELRTERDTQALTKIKYMGLSYLLYCTAAVDFLANYGVEIYPPGVVFILSSLAITSYAIAKHNVLDIKFVLKKTVYYALLLALLIAPCLLVVYFTEQTSETWIHYVVYSALLMVVGFIFPRVKVRAERSLDHLLFGRLVDYRNTLSNLSRKMARLQEVDVLLTMVTESMASAVDIEAMGIYLRNDATGDFDLHSHFGSYNVDYKKLAAHQIDPLNQESTEDDLMIRHSFNLQNTVNFPIRFENELIGIIVLVDTRHTLIQVDERLVLSTISHQLAIALHNSLQFKKIQQWNENLEKTVLERTSELERAAVLAHQASIAKSAFLSNMSHEIRTPLTAINGFGETLLDGDISSAERAEAVHAIVRNGTHLLHIVNDILDMSKIEAGKLQVECLAISLFEFMADIDSFIGKQATEKGLEFRIDYHYPLPGEIKTDPLRLKQILLNLGSNAVKFTRDGSIKIAVSCDWNSNALSFEFIDTGVGLAPDQEEKLFSPFTQADSSTTRRYGGTGLGLHLSKRLAELLGGTITVRSEPGVGSRFKVTVNSDCVGQSALVQAPPHATQNTTSTRTAPPADLLPLGGRVLLADDNPDNQRLISLFVRKMSLALTVVENGEQAVQRATMEDFDVILMDMQMPVMDGLTAVKILRGKNYAKPIIALTANVMKHDCELYAAAGCNDYIAKPLSRDWLYKVLARYLPMSAATASPICSLVLIEEPEVEDIVQRFVQGLHVTQEKIRRGAREENWAELKHIFHDIKGTGSSMGYPMLTELAQRMELHLMQGEYREMGECYVHFDAMCDRIYTGIRKVEQV